MASLNTLLGSVLLVSNRPLTLRYLADVTGRDRTAVREALAELSGTFASQDLGVKIMVNGDEYQMVSTPDASGVVESFLKAELLGDLTKPQLETLTVIAYRGPVAKSDIEMIRGVHSGVVLRNLMMRGLIVEHSNTAGALQYDLSTDALRHLGLVRREELPDFVELSTYPLLEAGAPIPNPVSAAR